MAVATASLLSATAFADSCASSFSGFYAGAQAGVNSTNGTSKYEAACVNNHTASDTFGKKSFLGGLFAGYGMGVGSCAYVGAELYINFGNTSVNLADSTGNNRSSTAKLSNKNAFGAKARLGYTVSPQAMIFLGLGLERSQWKSTEKAVNAGVTVYESKKSKSSVKFAPSVGMDMFVNKSLFVRGEYTYVLPTKIKDTTTVAGTTHTTKLSVAQQRFTLGLGYKF